MYREEGEPGIAFCHFPITTVCHLCKASLFLVLIHVSLLIGSKKTAPAKPFVGSNGVGEGWLGGRLPADLACLCSPRRDA